MNKYISVCDRCVKCKEYITEKCKGLLVYDFRDCPVKIRNWRKTR